MRDTTLRGLRRVLLRALPLAALVLAMPPQVAAHEGLEAGDGSARSEPNDPDHGWHAAGPEEDRGIPWLGRLHPPVVHFPIALLMSACLAELLAWRTNRSSLRDAARFCSWLGALGAVAAAGLGWFAAGLDPSSDEWPLTVHRWLGTATGLWGVALLLLLARTRDPASRARRYLAAVLLGGVLVAATGYFGGLLVHGMDHGHG